LERQQQYNKLSHEEAVLLALCIIVQRHRISNLKPHARVAASAASGEHGIGGSKCGATAVNTLLFTAPVEL
jgi:hypothetical protein